MHVVRCAIFASCALREARGAGVTAMEANIAIARLIRRALQLIRRLPLRGV